MKMYYFRSMTACFILCGLFSHEVHRVAIAEDAIDNEASLAIEQIREYAKSHQAQYEQTFSEYIAKPVIDLQVNTKKLFPTGFDDLYIGMPENELTKLKPKAEVGELGGLELILRPVYDFIPGWICEEKRQDAYTSICYLIYKRRLAQTLFVTKPFSTKEEKQNFVKQLLFFYVKTLGNPAKARTESAEKLTYLHRSSVACMEALGIPAKSKFEPRESGMLLGGAMLEWRCGDNFILLANKGNLNNVLLYVGSNQTYQEVIKDYVLDDCPSDEEYMVINQTFPSLHDYLSDDALRKLISESYEIKP